MSATHQTYLEKVEILKLKAQKLEEKIPGYAKAFPDVKAGMNLQAEAYRLMDEMAEIIDGGKHHGQC